MFQHSDLYCQIHNHADLRRKVVAGMYKTDSYKAIRRRSPAKALVDKAIELFLEGVTRAIRTFGRAVEELLYKARRHVKRASENDVAYAKKAIHDIFREAAGHIA